MRYTRFFPKELPALLMQRFEIHVQSDVELELRSGINLSSCNSPIPDDQVKENTELVQLAPLQFVTDDGSLFPVHLKLSEQAYALSRKSNSMHRNLRRESCRTAVQKSPVR